MGFAWVFAWGLHAHASTAMPSAVGGRAVERLEDARRLYSTSPPFKHRNLNPNPFFGMTEDDSDFKLYIFGNKF